MVREDDFSADLLLVHPPAYFDFRNERKIYFPFMSTSGDVPITPVYEFYPLGFKSLKKHITSAGYEVKIFNLCSFLLQEPDTDIERVLKIIDAKIVGLDLHWMVHVQGALKVAELLKKLHPDTIILLGGISSSYYCDELIKYPFIDMVMRGYDTHIPMKELVSEVKDGRSFHKIPNLIWKNDKGEIIDNEYSHLPTKGLDNVDWSDVPSNNKSLIPLLDIVSTSNVGCVNNCGWCGGSKKAFKSIYPTDVSAIHRNSEVIKREFDSFSLIENISKYNFYGCGYYNQSKVNFLKTIKEIGKYNFKSVNYEQYQLMDKSTLEEMVKANPKTIITLSPESHDRAISKLSGRGNYSMEEMEDWISMALKLGIEEIDIWFFIGMPRQDEKSVSDTIEYCDHILEKFKGQKVVPLICPLMPFLDPASEFFENPEEHGYTIFFKTVEEHQKGMMRASIINRMNYETKWLSREQIVKVGYNAIKDLFLLKKKHGLIPESIIDKIVAKMDDAMEFIDVVHEIDNIADEDLREQELANISDEIYIRNQEVFFQGVLNQAFPVMRKHGQRWFDYLS